MHVDAAEWGMLQRVLDQEVRLDTRAYSKHIAGWRMLQRVLGQEVRLHTRI